MFVKIVTIVFYVSIALYAFGLFLPIATPLLGLSAAVLAVVNML